MVFTAEDGEIANFFLSNKIYSRGDFRSLWCANRSEIWKERFLFFGIGV